MRIKLKNLLKWLRSRCVSKLEAGAIQNINFISADQPKALISYVTFGFRTSIDYPLSGTQGGEIARIVRILSRLGYCVDVADCKMSSLAGVLSERRYSALIGFGDLFFKLKNTCPDAKAILYMTENHPEFSKKEEEARCAYFYQRHGSRVDLCRSGYHYLPEQMDDVFDAIITMSDLEHFLSSNSRVMGIFPTAKFNPSWVPGHRAYETARNGLLWMGSAGAIHKGLDILLDAIAEMPEVVLHICGLDDAGARILRGKFPKNAINHGYVDVFSRDFVDIVNQCAFIALPSCSEACATSVTTGMAHELIPIVMKHSGFDRLGDIPVFLESYEIGYVRSKISDVVSLPERDLIEMGRRARNFALREFTLDAFEARLEPILSGILHQ